MWISEGTVSYLSGSRRRSVCQPVSSTWVVAIFSGPPHLKTINFATPVLYENYYVRRFELQMISTFLLKLSPLAGRTMSLLDLWSLSQ